MNPIELDTNKTTVFLLPILFPNSTHDEIFSNYVKQAYIGLIEDSGEIGKEILLEFDSEQITPDVFSTFIENIETPTAIAGEPEDNLLTYTFNDKEAISQLETVLRGEYSKLSEETKDIILEFWKEGDNSLLYAILYNNPEKVDEYTPHLNKDIIEELRDTNGESWPAPNLFVDEFLLL